MSFIMRIFEILKILSFTWIHELDLEMSFVSQEDVLSLTENLFSKMISTILPEKNIPVPFPRLTYQEAMDSYGIDRPDLRFGMKMHDLSDMFKSLDFQVFQNVISLG